MRNHFAPQTMDEIVAALPAPDAEPISARALHGKLDCWAFGSIRQALGALEKDGRAQSVIVPHRTDYMRLWKQGASASA